MKLKNKMTKTQKINNMYPLHCRAFKSFLAVPKSASAKLPSQGMTIVEGVISLYPFRTSLEAGKWITKLKMTKAMHDASGVKDGEAVAVEITRVADEPEIRVPVDLYSALKAVPRALATWNDITPMARRDWILWMITIKQIGTRKLHIKKACDMLSSGKRRVCCFSGIKWLIKDHDGATWVPLAKVK